MDTDCYDVIVLGAGVEGSSTAYYLTNKAGIRKVLLLEQFTALHDKGSSHGYTRCIHRGYKLSKLEKITNESYQMWSSLEKEGNTQLYIKSGLLYFLPEDSSLLSEWRENMEIYGVSHETFPASEANIRYSKQLSVPPDYSCLLEYEGGILLADKAMALYQRLFASAGGELRDEHPVTEIIPGQLIVVKTTKATFRTKKLIITAGAWTPSLLKPLGVELPFKVISTEVLYWKVDLPESFNLGNFPVFTFTDRRDNFFYGLPVYEYPRLIKICCHFGEEVEIEDYDTDRKTKMAAEMLSNVIPQYFKGVSATPSIVKPCLYTNIPSGDPVLDRHPEYSNIVIGAGFSGRGFKLSPVIGKILTELALHLTPSYDLSPFKLSQVKHL